jgi:hypothetical protein
MSVQANQGNQGNQGSRAGAQSIALRVSIPDKEFRQSVAIETINVGNGFINYPAGRLAAKIGS